MKMETIQKYTQDIIMQRKKKNYNVMIDGNNFFDQPVKSNIRTYNKTCKIATAEGDVYTSSCLTGYNYLKKYHKTIATDYNRKGY